QTHHLPGLWWRGHERTLCHLSSRGTAGFRLAGIPVQRCLDAIEDRLYRDAQLPIRGLITSAARDS
ncbi:MAG: hypothetical protein K0B14_19730, partial [Anaerolineaceae bacterium]|nr:hypothetical protein [Anaerolineaceae bacterium]